MIKRPPKIKPVHALQWIAEPLEDHPSFIQKKMFGCEAIRLHGKLMLVLAASDEPWNGLLVCTDREHHASLMRNYPVLTPHPILGKWLYVSQSDPEFEEVARSIAELARKADPRFGVESKPRKTRGKR